MMRITLTPEQRAFARSVGIKRHQEALRSGRRDAHGLRSQGADEHIVGAEGELAAAIAIGRQWDAPVNTFKVGGDVGKLQVRTRTLVNKEGRRFHPDHRELLIRPDDRREDIFILVHADQDDYIVCGVITGDEAMRPVNWKDIGNGRPKAWYIPAWRLYNIEHFREVLLAAAA